VTEANAHPHFDNDDRVHVVVNGIVENYMELKRELIDAGAVFTSETDVEVIAHLIARNLDEHGLIGAVRLAYRRLRGHYSFVAASAEEPDKLVAARKETPLVIGRRDGEQFVASGIPAFLAHTRDVQLPEDDDIVVIRADGVEFLDGDDQPVERPIERIDWDSEAARRAATRPSCSRRSTSRPTRSPRPSPTARSGPKGSTLATSGRSTTTS
jgi:glucosamine--fructose-6-phosphate aminotransferase (isomerizing)